VSINPIEKRTAKTNPLGVVRVAAMIDPFVIDSNGFVLDVSVSQDFQCRQHALGHNDTILNGVRKRFCGNIRERIHRLTSVRVLKN
jgi:hypothetical protein